MKRLWFRRKTYGWGWYPATWQGWLALVIYILLVALNAWRLGVGTGGPNTTLAFVGETYFLAVVLILVCYLTGEKPAWQWGDKNKK